ncbi:MAG TPA: hemerythrin domain-containing protein [Gemmatimonadales bacterium]|nr:hemerythrin domain-containing protein [Gemmatimonadales bacterium]
MAHSSLVRHPLVHHLAGAAAVLGVLLGAGAVRPAAAAAQEHAHGHDAGSAADTARGGIGIPEAMRVEHAEIHDALVRATRAPGRVGAAARKLAAVLDPHFQREEQIALPPLGLLAPLARGEYAPAMRAVLPLTDSLRAELPRMLAEHEAIHAATLELGAAARAAGNAPVARLAETLAAHARSEEQLFYPAAVLVGEVVRGRAGR